MTIDRRSALRSAARGAVAAVLGGLGLFLGLRRKRPETQGYCDHSGRCGGCPVTEDCHVHQAIGPGSRR